MNENRMTTDSDRDLERRIINFLEGRGVRVLRNIEVTADNGQVTLRGQLHSFYHKQLCLACCLRVAGVVTLDDQTWVVSAMPAPFPGGLPVRIGDSSQVSIAELAHTRTARQHDVATVETQTEPLLSV